MAGRLNGKAVLVTGASRGIGRAIALALAREGGRLALVARDETALAEVASSCGRDALTLTADLTEEAACRRVVAGCQEAFGRIDVLVNNAGTAESRPFLKTDTALWRSTMALDVEAPFWLIRAALPGMLERRSGSVISVASLAAHTGFAYVSPYVAAKHALLGLTRSLAAEFPRSGVTFNCVCPHYVDTPMTERTLANIVAKTGRSPEEALEALLPPSGRLVDPQEVAAVCVLLACGQATSINGQAIVVDGGASVS